VLAFTSSEIRSFLVRFLRMQKAIFDDMGWQHEAFIYGETSGIGGANLLKKIAAKGGLSDMRPEVRVRYIDNTWAVTRRYPVAAMRGLVLREQYETAQGKPGQPKNRGDGYNWFLHHKASGRDTGFAFLELSSLIGNSVIPGGTPFRQYSQRNVFSDLSDNHYIEVWGNVGEWKYRSAYIDQYLNKEAGEYLAEGAVARPLISKDISTLAQRHRCVQDR